MKKLQEVPFTGKMMMMPGPPDKCPECATDHPKEYPHNNCLFYQYKFYYANGRWPDWADAMAHCSQEMKDTWIKELARKGIEVKQ